MPHVLLSNQCYTYLFYIDGKQLLMFESSIYSSYFKQNEIPILPLFNNLGNAKLLYVHNMTL